MNFFKRYGVVCPKLLEKHVEKCVPKIPSTFRFHDEHGTLQRLECLSGYHAFFEGLFKKPGSIFRTMASDITGKRMYLLKDKILYKHPGKKGIDPHTDDLFLPLPSWTGMLAIDRCHAENGHLQLLLPKDPTADAVDSMIRQNMGLDPRDVKYEIAQLEHKEWAWKGIDLEAGDIVWFPGRLFHRALDNVSSSPRTVILLNYTSDPNFSYHDYFHHPHYRTI